MSAMMPQPLTKVEFAAILRRGCATPGCTCHGTPQEVLAIMCQCSSSGAMLVAYHAAGTLEVECARCHTILCQIRVASE